MILKHHILCYMPCFANSDLSGGFDPGNHGAWDNSMYLFPKITEKDNIIFSVCLL